MGTYTPNLGLVRPDLDEKVNVQEFNGNMDILDRHVGDLEAINATIANKIDKPSAGLEGKFLQVDMNGNPVWDDPMYKGEVQAAIDAFLQAYLPIGETVFVDASLLMRGAAADARETGIRFGLLNKILDVHAEPIGTRNLNQTPYATETLNGVTFTVGIDNSVTLSGTADANTYWPDYRDARLRWRLSPGTYTFSGGSATDNWRSPSISIFTNEEDTVPSTSYALTTGSPTVTFSVESQCWAVVTFFIDSRNSDLSGYVFKAQVESGTEATQYQSPWGEYETQSLIDTKVDKYQGLANAGKALMIGEDGNLAPETIEFPVDATLRQPGSAADAKATGDGIRILNDVLDIYQVPLGTVNINRTPYESETYNGITFTVNEDNSISMSGTPTMNTYWPNYRDSTLRWKIHAGTYTFSGGTAADNWRAPILALFETEETASPVATYQIGSALHRTETITILNDYWAMVYYFIDGRNSELTGYSLMGQVEAGEEAHDYQSPWGEFETKSNLDDKVNIMQGTAHAGKAMVVGNDGKLTPQDVNVVVDPTLSHAGMAADAKAAGEAMNGVKNLLEYDEFYAPSRNLNQTRYTTGTQNGVTFTVNDDNSVSLSGTPTANVTWPNINDASMRWQISSGTYTLYGGSDGDNWRSISLCLFETADTTTISQTITCGSNGGAPVTFTLDHDCWAAVRFGIDSRNSELTGHVLRPQVERGSSASDYVSPDPVLDSSSALIENMKVKMDILTENVEHVITMISEDMQLDDSMAPTPIIIDTDIAGDTDDVLAMRTASYFESIGAVRIVMACCTFNSIYSYRGLNALFEYDGTMGVPISLLRSNYSQSYGRYLDVLISYPHTAVTPPTIYGATAYRKVLPTLTKKCVIVCLGPLTNISNLLNSGPDEYSGLTGRELVQAKVEKLVIMGGAYPNSVTAMNGAGAEVDGVVVPGAEWNFAGDIPATANVIENCPVPMVFCGWEIGQNVPCGGSISDKLPVNDIMIAAMFKHGGASEVRDGRHGWDPITMAAACLGDGQKMGFELVRGTVLYNSTNSTNTFSEDAYGQHYYLKRKYDDDYYKIYMNHILSKDWWGTNNTAKMSRAVL